MATKKDDNIQQRGAGAPFEDIDERRRRKREAVTVDGTESFPPVGMDKPDGGVVTPEEADKAVQEGQGDLAKSTT